MSPRSLLHLSLVTLAHATTWYGLRVDGPTGGSLVTLTDGGAVQSSLGSIALPTGGGFPVDAMRCLPGYCVLAVLLPTGNTLVHNVSTVDASPLTAPAACSGACTTMHVDHTSGDGLTVCTTGGRTLAVRVTHGVCTTVLDVSTQVGSGTPGPSSHCSVTNHIYLGVSHGGVGDAILDINLRAANVDGTTVLQGAPLPTALWASCDGTGAFGGVWGSAGGGGSNTTATVQLIAVDGTVTSKASVGLPSGVVLSGLLAGTSPSAIGNEAFLAAAYPAGTLGNQTANGWVWAVDPYGGGADDYVSPVVGNLVGAAWDA